MIVGIWAMIAVLFLAVHILMRRVEVLEEKIRDMEAAWNK